MKVLRLHGIGDVRIEDEQPPTPQPDRTLVQVRAVGICGSDLHWFEDGAIGDAGLTRPLVPGHEMAGVALDGPHAGKLVALDPAMPCGHCPLCLEGHRNLCENMHFSGHSDTDGAMTQILSWPTDLVHPLPAGFTAADGAVLEPLGVALHALDLSKIRIGDTVAVIGCGPIGLLTIQLCLVAGAGRVVAVEPLVHRREAARKAGAEVVLTPDEARDPATWQRHTGLGCPVVFEASGMVDPTNIAMIAARPGGRVMLIGIPGDDTTTFAAGHARRKGLDLREVRRMKEMYERTIDLVQRGKVDVKSVVTATYGLDEGRDAFVAASQRQGLKVVIDPGA